MHPTTLTINNSSLSGWLNFSQLTIIRESLYACALVLLVYFLRKLDGDTGMLAIPLGAAAWYYRQPFWQARIIIFVLCGSSSIGAALYCASLMMLMALQALSSKSANLNISRQDIMLVLFVGLAIISWALNQFVSINIVALPLWSLSFLVPLGVYFYFRRWPLSAIQLSHFMVFMIAVAFAQCFVAWIDYIKGIGFQVIWSYAMTPDFVTGTFRNAPEFGVYLLQVATFFISILISSKLLTKTTIKTIPLLAFILIFIHTSDSKSQLYAFIGGWLAILIVFWKWRWNDKATKWIVSGLLVTAVLGPPMAVKVLDKYNTVYSDYLEGDKAAKIIYMKDALDPSSRSFFHWLAGYGPGSCGSRASNMRAYDTLPKNRDSDAHQVKSFIPEYSSECTKQFLVPVWDQEYAENSKYRSALLGNPFNSWTAIWFEMGLLGVAFWLILMAALLATARKIYLKSLGIYRLVSMLAGVNIVAICVIALITQAFEDPKLMMFLWFFIAHTISTKTLGSCPRSVSP